MAAPRAYWSGQIRLALVSIPVEIYSAARSTAGIAFNQIHEPSGKRVKYEKVVPGIGPVDPADKSEAGPKPKPRRPKPRQPRATPSHSRPRIRPNPIKNVVSPANSLYGRQS